MNEEVRSRSERKYQFLLEEIQGQTVTGNEKTILTFVPPVFVSGDVIFLSPRSLNYEIIIARGYLQGIDTRMYFVRLVGDDDRQNSWERSRDTAVSIARVDRFEADY